MRIALAHQHLRHIVQDREQTVEVAPKIWGDKHKELFDSGRISFQAQDFFTAQPTVYKVPGVGEVKHAAVFVLTRVTHNWDDDRCKTYVLPARSVLLRMLTLPLRLGS